jgi:hypothetical protein
LISFFWGAAGDGAGAEAVCATAVIADTSSIARRSFFIACGSFALWGKIDINLITTFGTGLHHQMNSSAAHGTGPENPGPPVMMNGGERLFR